MNGACSSSRSRPLYLPASSRARSVRINSFSLAQASGNTSASAVPWKSSSVRRAYSAPVFFEICRFTTVTTAPIRTRWSLHWPRVAVVRVPKSSTSTRYRARGWPEMKNPSTAFSRVNRSCSDHGATSGSRARGAGSGACSPNRATWPDSRSPCRVCASPNAASSVATSWARCPPSESQAPASISASRTRLLQRRRSIRSHRSTSERYGPSAVRPARIDSIAPAPTFLIAPRPKGSRRWPRTVPQREGPLDEAAQLVLDQLLVLLPDRFAQHVGFGEREAGEHVGDAHHLLLIGDYAVRGLEDLRQRGVRVAHGLAAELPVDEHEVHPGIERAGTEQRVGRHQVVEPIAPHAAEAVGGERRLELEHAGRAARPEQLVDLRVLEVQRVHIERDPVALRDHPHRVMDHGQRAQAEHVDLQHPHLLERDHVVLGDDRLRLLRREADGDVVGERPGGDHHAGGVHRGVARQALDPGPELEDLADTLVLEIGRAHV